jgi:hypothetical protein
MRLQVKIRTIQERKNVMMGKDRILIRKKMQAAEKSLNEFLNLALVVFFLEVLVAVAERRQNKKFFQLFLKSDELQCDCFRLRRDAFSSIASVNLARVVRSNLDEFIGRRADENGWRLADRICSSPRFLFRFRFAVLRRRFFFDDLEFHFFERKI